MRKTPSELFAAFSVELQAKTIEKMTSQGYHRYLPFVSLSTCLSYKTQS